MRTALRKYRSRLITGAEIENSNSRGPVTGSQDNRDLSAIFCALRRKLPMTTKEGIESGGKKKYSSGWMLRSLCFIPPRFRLANYRRRDIYGSVGSRILENWQNSRDTI